MGSLRLYVFCLLKHVFVGLQVCVSVSEFCFCFCISKIAQMYRVFIKYCVISKILKYVPDSGLSRFLLSVSVCVQNGRSITSAAAELAKLRKIKRNSGKTQYLMNTCR